MSAEQPSNTGTGYRRTSRAERTVVCQQQHLAGSSYIPSQTRPPEAASVLVRIYVCEVHQAHPYCIQATTATCPLLCTCCVQADCCCSCCVRTPLVFATASPGAVKVKGPFSYVKASKLEQPGPPVSQMIKGVPSAESAGASPSSPSCCCCCWCWGGDSPSWLTR